MYLKPTACFCMINDPVTLQHASECAQEEKTSNLWEVNKFLRLFSAFRLPTLENAL